MKISSSKNKKIERDALEKDDLLVGVNDSQGLNKGLVLMEASKAFVDGVFSRIKDIFPSSNLSEEVKQLREEVSALKKRASK